MASAHGATVKQTCPSVDYHRDVDYSLPQGCLYLYRRHKSSYIKVLHWRKARRRGVGDEGRSEGGCVVGRGRFQGKVEGGSPAVGLLAGFVGGVGKGVRRVLVPQARDLASACRKLPKLVESVARDEFPVEACTHDFSVRRDLDVIGGVWSRQE